MVICMFYLIIFVCSYQANLRDNIGGAVRGVRGAVLGGIYNDFT